MLTNQTDLPLSLAVWLAHDTYDYDPHAVSATALLRSTRQLILKNRVQAAQSVSDVSGLIPSSFGNAVHDAIHQAWSHDAWKLALAQMEYPDHVIKNILVNPDPDRDLPPGALPIYIEQRFKRVLDGITVSGKVDFVIEGILEDFKTSGVYNFMSGSNDWKYRMQGSIYRWLRPDVITSDHMFIRFIFTDWSKVKSMQEKKRGYPQSRIMTKQFDLLSMAETETWIRGRIKQVLDNKKLPEPDLPHCTPDELWQGASVFKFYSDPNKRKRSSGNFPTFEEAQLKNLDKGGTGIVIEVPGKVKACGYCDAFGICTQKDQLIQSGQLEV